MSHDHLPQNNSTADTSPNLRTYFLNGQEVPLTEEQAKALGAQPINHSGDLGLENPAEGARPISGEISADDLPQTMPFNPKDKKQARDVQGKKKWYERNSVRIGIGSTVAGIAAVAAVAAGVTGGGDSTPDRKEDSASAPADPTPTPEANHSASTPEVDLASQGYNFLDLDLDFIKENDLAVEDFAVGEFRDVISKMINERANNESAADLDTEMGYLAEGQAVTQLNTFLSTGVSYLENYRDEISRSSDYTEPGIPNVLLYSELLDAKKNADGSFSASVEFTYGAQDSISEDTSGWVVGNVDKYIIDLAPRTLLVDDQQVDTYVLTKMQEIEKRPEL